MRALASYRMLPFLIAAMGLHISSCKNDPVEPTTQYTVAIMSPDNADKHLGDTIHIHVNFDEAAMGTVHHVGVKIIAAGGGAEVYSQPADAHVHAETGHYEHHDDFILSAANGIDPHTDWVLEAKVWGHDDGVAEVTQTLQFHVHP